MYLQTESLLFVPQSQIYMMEQSKRSMELQNSQMQLHGRMMERVYADLQITCQNEKRSRRKYKEKLKMFKVQSTLHVHSNAIHMYTCTHVQYKNIYQCTYDLLVIVHVHIGLRTCTCT